MAVVAIVAVTVVVAVTMAVTVTVTVAVVAAHRNARLRRTQPGKTLCIVSHSSNCINDLFYVLRITGSLALLPPNRRSHSRFSHITSNMEALKIEE